MFINNIEEFLAIEKRVKIKLLMNAFLVHIQLVDVYKHQIFQN